MFGDFPAKNTVYIHRIWPYVWWFPCQKYRIYTPYMTVCLVISLPKIPYIHRIWPNVWWFPCQKYRIYTLYMTVCLVISLPKIPYICTVYDRMYGDFPAKNTIYLHCIWPNVWWFPCQKYRIYTPYDRIFGDFPAKNTIYTLYDRIFGDFPAKIPYICTENYCMFGDFPAKNTVCTPYIPGRPHGGLTQTVPISYPPNLKPTTPHLNASYLMLYLNHWRLLEIRHSGGLCRARCVFCTPFGREKVHFWTCHDWPLLQDISFINVV